MADFESTLDSLAAEDLARINVVGLSGSGKSTIARRLANALRAEYIEMDRLFHGPNWTEANENDFRERVADAIAPDRWVLDGNYHSKTHDLKWARATSIVWVNTPFARNMLQSTSRAIQRAWTQKELWPGTGNRETFRKTFLSRQSILLWALTNYRKIQRRYSSVQSDPKWSPVRFVELRTRQEGERLVDRATRLTHSSSI